MFSVERDAAALGLLIVMAGTVSSVWSWSPCPPEVPLGLGDVVGVEPEDGPTRAASVVSVTNSVTPVLFVQTDCNVLVPATKLTVAHWMGMILVSGTPGT